MNDLAPTAPSPRLAALLAAAVLVGVAASEAHAVTLRIDPAHSSVTYDSHVLICDPFFNCGPVVPQTFALSGRFDATLQRESFPVSFFPELSAIELDIIRFSAIDVDAGGAATLGFTFPTYPGVVDGPAFGGNENPCSLFFLQGSSCFSIGAFGNFSGTFDGTVLTMNGVDPVSFLDAFTFTLVATAEPPSAVPLPGTLPLLAGALLGVAALRRRRS